MLPGVVHMLGWRVVAVAAVLAVLGGCSDAPTGQPEPTDSSPNNTTEPKPEPTGPETTQPTRKKPSFEYANAPIGSSPGEGDPDTGPERCIELDWGAASLPDGVTIRLGAPRIETTSGKKSTKVFRIDNSVCTRKGKGPRCNGFRIDQGACHVGVRQVTRKGDLTVILTLSATATCSTRQLCDELKKKGEGSGIPLTSVDLEQPSPSETPIEPPPETPVETPADSPAPETPAGDG